MKALIIDNVSPLIPEGLKARGVEVHIEVMPGTERIKEIIGEYDVLIMRVVRLSEEIFWTARTS